MTNFFDKIRLLATDKDLRKRIFFVLGALLVFRLGANIPIPGIDVARLTAFFEGNQFLGLLNVFSGGGLSNLSIFMLGVGPYITATIIMQLLSMMIPRLREMLHEEGTAGKKKFTQYSRILTVPLAVIQGFSLLLLLKNNGVLGTLTVADQVFNIIIVVAGSMFLMWIGELMTEYGIGNGVSLIIFAGIVASIPSAVSQLLVTFDPSQVPLFAGFFIAAVLIIFGIIVVTEAERPIPVTYAKRIRGMKMYGGTSTYLPLRVNQAGVIPIIFALSILLFPQMLAGFLSQSTNSIAQAIAGALNFFVSNLWVYGFFYFALVFVFTYFYTAVTFDPDALSNNLQKNGAFVPGVRPGPSTATYIGKVLGRITLVGALFLGFIAVLPFVMQAITGNQTLAIGGTGLLIVVSVVLDLVKKIDGQLSMREY